MKSGAADQPLRLGDASFTLRFSVKALAAMQEHWQLASFQEVEARLARLESEMSIDDIVGVLWAGLRSHHPDMTPAQILDLLDECGMDGVMEAIGRAFGNAMPDAEDAPPDPYEKKVKKRAGA